MITSIGRFRFKFPSFSNFLLSCAPCKLSFCLVVSRHRTEKPVRELSHRLKLSAAPGCQLAFSYTVHVLTETIKGYSSAFTWLCCLTTVSVLEVRMIFLGLCHIRDIQYFEKVYMFVLVEMYKNFLQLESLPLYE